MKTILILKGPGEGVMLVDALALRWTQAGHRVITHHGPKGLPDADIVVLHVDATRIPLAYLRRLRAYPAVVNGGAVDISKPQYSKQVVRADDDYQGPVIVKTKLNFGGIPEQQRRGRVRRLLHGVRRRGWKHLDSLDPLDYPIFDRKRDVPAGAWSNPNLMVERFVPEKEGELFFVRYWIFFGDQGWACRFGSQTPIAKFHTRVTAEEPVPVPGELVELRRRLGVDYGRIDYVQHHGKVVVFDVNKTLGGGGDQSEYAHGLDAMASGIDHFLRARAPSVS